VSFTQFDLQTRGDLYISLSEKLITKALNYAPSDNLSDTSHNDKQGQSILQLMKESGYQVELIKGDEKLSILSTKEKQAWLHLKKTHDKPELILPIGLLLPSEVNEKKQCRYQLFNRKIALADPTSRQDIPSLLALEASSGVSASNVCV